MKRYIFSTLTFFLSISLIGVAQVDPDLALYFSFDQLNGDVVPDQSGNGNDGTLSTDADLEDDGKYEKAIRFDAGLKIALDGANFAKIPAEAVTMAVWVNLDGVGGDQELFDCIGTGHGSGQYHFELKSGGAVRWFHRDENETQIFSIQQGVTPAGEWAHIAGTYDSDAGEAALYINGEEITRAPGNGDLSTDWAVEAGIGNHKGGRQLLGLVDEYYIFRRALDVDEISDLIDGKFGPFLAVQPGGKLATIWGDVKSSQ